MHRAPLFILLVAGSCLFQASCEDTVTERPKGWPDGTFFPDAQIILDASTSDLGLVPDGLAGDSEGPTIVFLTPTKAQVITNGTLTARVKITDKDTVDFSSIKITLQGTKAKPMSATSTPDIYEAKLDLTKLSGKGRIIVEAADLKEKKNSATVEFVYDAGPTITFTAPGSGSNHKDKVTLQVVVTGTVKITSFKVRVGSDLVAMQKVVPGEKQQVWVGAVTFSNYKPPLSGSQILTAEATNSNGARSTKILSFTVDDKGPTISIMSQKAGAIIGGVIKISAKVTDAAGVLESSVKCVIGNGKTTQVVVLKNSKTAPTTFTGQFDTRTLLQTFLWPVMSFRATDKLGNESHNDILVGLDNGQPVMELNPPEDFHTTLKKTGKYYCSRPFDPVGSDAANDKQQVPQVTFFRGRFQDQGNDIPSAPWIPFVGIKNSTVFMYVLDDTSQALVYDSNGDGYCDKINPEILPLGSKPTATEAVALMMAPITPIGAADFRPPWFNPGSDAGATPPDAGSGTSALLPSACVSWGTKTKEPSKMCLSTPLTTAISYATTKLPAIYTIPPVAPKASGFTCSGLPFDFLANKISNGWACVAATGTDTLGNRGVTPPLRVYVNNSPTFLSPSDTLPSSAGSPPNCTGTLNKSTGKVDASKSCKFRNPRLGSYPSQNIYKCDPTVKKAQMFCHNEVRLAP